MPGITTVILLVTDPPSRAVAGVAGSIGLALFAPFLGLLEWL